MGVIPEELIKDAPSFTEFLAFYTKSRADWQEKWDQEMAELRERRKEAEREMAEFRERRKVAEREMAELREIRKEVALQMMETDRKIQKLSENIGGLNNTVGALIETLIAARLWEKFPEYGLQRAYRRLPIFDEHNQPKTDIDILLVDSEWAMAVEVKREADRKDVEHHVTRMGRILTYPPAQLAPGIKLLGAVAGGIVENDAREYAHQCGFYVLELTGETVSRIPEPPDFKAKVW
jgi:hypothetical protein